MNLPVLLKLFSAEARPSALPSSQTLRLGGGAGAEDCGDLGAGAKKRRARCPSRLFQCGKSHLGPHAKCVARCLVRYLASSGSWSLAGRSSGAMSGRTATSSCTGSGPICSPLSALILRAVGST
ncbi:hypothetical protein EDF62_0574 [Leucobacter luti]|uniref:Uncharacterized protein n=1 Tax=Leucobacter luti TaxID=340320 RepID=A0A4R6S7T8_9MICO|nr:hypothetical protein EDF62_0574 [Leucobacter luti]